MKFKQPILFLFTFFIFFSNVELALNIHYCGNEIAVISVQTPHSSSSSEENCCGLIEKKSHCCHNKVVTIQKKADPGIVKSKILITKSVFQSKYEVPIIVANPIAIKSQLKSTIFSFKTGPPLYKLYHQFVFYS